ncbi:aspartic peptidase domain-containing protein [Mycena polygramma]|nr:aspartic peptidase domain-containing protein [Mycena polygramma]
MTSSYAGGGVDGTIGFATVEMGGYTFANQAFLNATRIGLALITKLGLDGLIGTAFDSNGDSDLKAALKKHGMNDTLGEPFLFNIFNLTPQQDNFVSISLSRTDDLEGSAKASLGINALDMEYLDVITAPELPIYSGIWAVLVDAISVDNVSITLPTSAVSHAPAGKMVALLDTGTPEASLPAKLLDAIYSAIPGSTYLYAQNAWSIPCNTTSILTVQMGGRSFPIHPLDLSTVQTDEFTNTTTCVAAIGAGPADSDCDAVFGDTFLRNMYQVYNFGDSISHSPTANASVQLVSQTDPKTAVAEVLNVRMARLSGQTSTPSGAAAAAAVAHGTSSSDNDPQVHKYAPIVIGLLGANLLVALILAVIGVAMCTKKRGGRNGRTTKFAPMQLRGDDYEDKHYSD